MHTEVLDSIHRKETENKGKGKLDVSQSDLWNADPAKAHGGRDCSRTQEVCEGKVQCLIKRIVILPIYLFSVT